MSEPIEIVDQHETFRLIRETATGRHAVIEVRNGRAYSLHGRDRHCQAPTAEGMAALVEPDGWRDEAQARAVFEEVVRGGENYAKEIW